MISESIPRTHTVIFLRKYQVEELNKQALSLISGPNCTSMASDVYVQKRTFELEKSLSNIAPIRISVKQDAT